jgi:hypothetical protein
MLARQAFLRAVENAGEAEFEGAVERRQLERRRRLFPGPRRLRSLIRPRAYSVRMLMTLEPPLGPAVPATCLVLPGGAAAGPGWPAIRFWRLLDGSRRVDAMPAFADVNGARQ